MDREEVVMEKEWEVLVILRGCGVKVPIARGTEEHCKKAISLQQMTLIRSKPETPHKIFYLDGSHIIKWDEVAALVARPVE